MSLINLTPAQLRQAADLKERIASLNQELTAIFGGSATPAPVKATQPVVAKKGGISAAHKAKLSAAAKARWAKIRAAKVVPTAKAPQAVKPAAKPVRVISAAARAKMAAAAKAMWVRIRAAKAAKKK